MAGRLVLWNNDADQIKGTCTAEGFAGSVELTGISFSATAAPDKGDGDKPSGGSTRQSAITVTLAHGPWVADLQQRLYHGKTLGTVTLTEVEQKVDAGKKTWKKIREITLTEAWMESMSHSWSGIHSSVSFSVGYQDSTTVFGDKLAQYNGKS